MSSSRRLASAALSLATLAALGAPSAASAAAAPPATAAIADDQVAGNQTGWVDFRAGVRTIDGFGIAEAFHRADVIHGARGLSVQHQPEVLDLLLSRDRGVGISILRLGMGSTMDGGAGRITAYVTDNDHSLPPTDAATLRGGRQLTVNLAPRSLTTVLGHETHGHP